MRTGAASVCICASDFGNALREIEGRFVFRGGVILAEKVALLEFEEVR